MCALVERDLAALALTDGALLPSASRATWHNKSLSALRQRDSQACLLLFVPLFHPLVIERDGPVHVHPNRRPRHFRVTIRVFFSLCEGLLIPEIFDGLFRLSTLPQLPSHQISRPTFSSLPPLATQAFLSSFSPPLLPPPLANQKVRSLGLKSLG